MTIGPNFDGVQLDYEGGAEVLKNVAEDLVHGVARTVAAAAGDDAEVSFFTTDRAVALIRVPANQQAKDGVLTRAAAAAGLEVRSK